MKDYYGVLGIGCEAGEKEIKSAYRRLAKRTHPDMVGAGQKKIAEEQFKVIAEAYYVLSDKYRRCEYDLSRKSDDQGQGFKVQGQREDKGQKPTEQEKPFDYFADDILEEILRYANEEYYKVDRMEYAVRFGCGGFLGFFVGLYFAFDILSFEDHKILYCILAGIGIFGFLSAIYGEKFWNFIFRYRGM